MKTFARLMLLVLLPIGWYSGFIVGKGYGDQTRFKLDQPVIAELEGDVKQMKQTNDLCVETLKKGTARIENDEKIMDELMHHFVGVQQQ